MVFCLSLVDCTSSVLYFPYMARFRETYMISFMIGEGCSGLIPALASLAQVWSLTQFYSDDISQSRIGVKK